MFVVLESKKLKPAKGFEHVKGYREFSAGKPRGCSGHVYKYIYIYCIYWLPSGCQTWLAGKSPLHECNWKIISQMAIFQHH